MRINFRIFIRVLGLLTLIIGIAMIPCGLFAIAAEEKTVAFSFLVIGSLSICIGYILINRFQSNKIQFKAAQGFLIASLSWVYASLLGALPFILSGEHYSIISCIFESVAGFTTTGGTVLDLTTLPKALLLWRSIENWLGGMGILVLITSLFPTLDLDITSQSIASVETTGPFLKKLGGRFSDTGKILYMIYTFFTIVEFLLLWIGPLNAYDALISTLSSVSTGGLVVTPANSIAFQSVYTRGVILVFTILSSLNFTLFFFLLQGRWKSFIQNYELKVFLKIIAVGTILVSLSLKFSGTYSSLWQAIKDSLFQVVSFISTSGYYVCDYTRWPTFAIIVLFTLMFIGGCTMSTSGSLKVLRVIVFSKLIKRGIFKQIHPNAVKAVVVDGKAVSARHASAITSHILLYFLVLLVSSVLLSLNNLDMETTLTSAIGLFSNTGIAMGVAGAIGDFSIFNGFSQMIFCILMTAGRLEMYSLLLLFTSTFWKEKRKY